MLLKVSPPKQLGIRLQLASSFMIRLLYYCDVKGIQPKQFTKKQFLIDHPELKACVFANKTATTFKNRINDFWDACKAKKERKTVILALCVDNFFMMGPKGKTQIANFSFQSYQLNIPQYSLDLLKTLFTRFYNDFFNYEENGSNLRWHFKEEYKLENPDNFYLCPACLGELNLDKAQLDHYFPKSTHLALVIHPNNLIPLCISCNSTTGGGKGDKIPTNPAIPTQANRIGCLEDAYLPYESYGLGRVKMLVGGTPGKRMAQLTTMKAADRTPLLNHAETYDLNRVWTSRLHNANTTLIHRLVDAFRHTFETDGKLDSAAIAHFLQHSIIQGAEYKSSKIENYFILANYTVWILGEPNAWITLIDELQKRLEEEKKLNFKQKQPYFLGDPEP
ncbi:HNH endonuclease signature motif containing protein [Paenibacillus sp. FSL H8-0537]|uniref:HNH endonuclease n=1 Tax=Paenibacillus sp. FSL H8-0537 TaxID=2921399 RepID=UPI00310111A7